MEKEKNVLLLLTLSSKKCTCCNEVKPTTEFTKKKIGEKCGFSSQCKACIYKKRKEYRLDNPEEYNRIKRNQNLRKYGLTFEDQEGMLREQNYKCAICGQEIFLFGSSQKLIAHVDHDHKTGKVRGLLCKECNSGLGKFRDNTEYLFIAISYLKKNK